MTDEEKAEEYVDALLHKDDTELDKFLDANLGDLKLNNKQAGTLLGLIKGVGICSYLDGLAEGRKETTEKYSALEKENAELKKEISILLSCANCKENKGGYVCEKEYNDKCLAQKIEYIKELKEEITELKARNEGLKCCENCKHYMSFADEEPCVSCCLLYKDEKENKWEKAE